MLLKFIKNINFRKNQDRKHVVYFHLGPSEMLTPTVFPHSVNKWKRLLKEIVKFIYVSEFMSQILKEGKLHINIQFLYSNREWKDF